ncbi:unnamed protein product [Euphydryas editha]|uniref:CRC domain-containing protein n=1 Tax=Euphydryas editha TaxID=104508 RepID=A0AAU9TVF3_EUPED|nr:unnamed protein product [Euphydryas editha]
MNNNMQIEDKSAVECRYDIKLHEFYENHSKKERNMKKLWSSERISQVIQQIKEIRVTTQRKSTDYYWISKYDILEIADEEILIFKKKNIDESTIRIGSVEKYYEILTAIHKTVGHGDRYMLYVGFLRVKKVMDHMFCAIFVKSEQLIVHEREQAHRVIKTAKKVPLLEIGNSVLLNVPKIDHGPLDTKNILGKKCICKPSKNQCLTNRCACFKNKSLCTSKCHQSFSCINK